MPKRVCVIVCIVVFCLALVFCFIHRPLFLGVKPHVAPDMRLFDKIITPELIKSAYKRKASFLFRIQPELDGIRAYVAVFQFPKQSPDDHFDVFIGVAKAGSFLEADRYRRSYEEMHKTYADRGPKFLRDQFPAVGKRALREFFGAGPGGAGYGLTFTTGDECFDIRIAVSNMLPNDVDEPDIDLLALARSIEARYIDKKCNSK